MEIKYYIGNFAAFFSCIFLFPQLWKIYMTKNVMSISFFSISIGFIAQCLWICFAIITLTNEKSNIILLFKSICIVMVYLCIIFFYLKYSKNESHQLFYKKHNINKIV